MLDFPAAPIDGEEYDNGNVIYAWDAAGEVWKKVEVSPTQWVAKGGDLMTGELGLPLITPLLPETATNKRYVDQAIAAMALYQGTWLVSANTPDLTPSVVNAQNGYSWVAVTVDPTIPEVVPPGILGIEGTSLTEGDSVLWNGTLGIYEVIRAVAMTGNYLVKTGDVMTGVLDVQSAPANGTMSLLPGDATNNGRIEWANPDGTRKAYFGYQSPTTLQLELDSATNLYVSGGCISFGTQIGAGLDDITKGIEIYSGTNGMGISSSSGGQFNFVLKNAAHAFNFRVGGTSMLIVNANGCVIGSAAAAKGFYIGDIYHGMTFNGSNTTQFVEWHARWEWRQRTSAGVDTIIMSLYGGTLDLQGGMQCRGQMNVRRVNGMLWNEKSLIVSHTDTDGTQTDTPGEAGIAFYNYNGSDGGLRKHNLTLEKVGDRFCARGGDAADGACIKFVSAGFDVVSDLVYKHDVRPMEWTEAETAFAALDPIRFRWRDGEDQRLQWGLSANALEHGAPDAVTTGSFDEKSYGIEQVLAIAIAKIKILEAEIAALKAQPRDKATVVVRR